LINFGSSYEAHDTLPIVFFAPFNPTEMTLC
jgi:hypothetical protein